MSKDLPNLGDLLKKTPPAKQSSAAQTADDDETRGKFDSKILEIKKKELELEAERLAGQAGFPYLNLERFPVSQEALKQVPRAVAEELQAVCFFVTPDEVRIGAVDPTSEDVAQLLYDTEERNHVNGALYLISEQNLNKVLEMYNRLPVVAELTKDVVIKSEDILQIQANVNDFDSVRKLLNGKSTTDILTIILGAAMKLDASDVHVEAEALDVVARFRLDGILHDAARIPKELHKQLVSRIKLMSSLKININDKPQDGRFTIKFPEYDMDVRVSVIPTVYGESIVMRLLRQTEEGLDLDSLGVRGRALASLRQQIVRPNGMIIATGPTGSGKTTTLYAIVRLLNKPGVKILTLEDPVEYRVEGINQSQIDLGRDYTFAKGLRSMLRQDPDIMMVGEIRDLETADIAIQASLTGRLLLSTIHTNSAAGAIPRFIAMGVKPFLLTPSLNCVIGQRLVRKVCGQCRIKKPLAEFDEDTRTKTEAVIAGLPSVEAGEVKERPLVFYGANIAGQCVKCNGLGYKGRISVCEILIMTPEIQQAINNGNVSELEIEKMARINGMLTMAGDGVVKALDGITTLDEVFRMTE
ncbi:MAG: GspE/PulE family protein [Patescibacteria group bacterium]